MFELHLNVNDKPDFEYGQKLYVVEPDPTGNNSTAFSEKCPVCDNTRKINYKGYELKCSYCDRLSANYISIRKYVVREYFVNEFVVEGPESISGMKTQLPVVKKICAFTRWGHGYNDIKKKQLFVYDVDPDDQQIKEDRRMDNFVFTSKNAAYHALEIIMEKERDNLNKFNDEHGTSYEFPY